MKPDPIAMLQENEWVDRNSLRPGPHCLFCLQSMEDGHAEGCRWVEVCLTLPQSEEPAVQASGHLYDAAAALALAVNDCEGEPVFDELDGTEVILRLKAKGWSVIPASADRVRVTELIHWLQDTAIAWGHELATEREREAMVRARADLEEAFAALSTAPEQRRVETSAVRDVLAERQRQMSVEGWTPEHDDRHDNGALALAAAAYAYGAHYDRALRKIGARPNWWPWDARWWKPGTPRRDLVKAGALILAEIERLDRLAPRATTDHDGGADGTA